MGLGPVRLYAIRLTLPHWEVHYKRESSGLYAGTRYWWMDLGRWRICLIATRTVA